MKFHVTTHQALRLAERELSLESLKNVVKYPDSAQVLNRGRHGGNLKKFRKTVDEKTLIVVAEIKREESWLATAYYGD